MSINRVFSEMDAEAQARSAPHTQKVRQKLRFDAMVVESGIQGEKKFVLKIKY